MRYLATALILLFSGCSFLGSSAKTEPIIIEREFSHTEWQRDNEHRGHITLRLDELAPEIASDGEVTVELNIDDEWHPLPWRYRTTVQRTDVTESFQYTYSGGYLTLVFEQDYNAFGSFLAHDGKLKIKLLPR